MSSGADPNEKNSEDETLLMIVAKQEIEKKDQKFIQDTIKLLLSKGLQVNAKNKRGLSALHLAFNRNNTDLITILVNQGAEVDSADNNGFTVLRKAIIKFLQSKEIAVSDQYKKLVLFLIERRANLNLTDKSGKTILSELALQFDSGKKDSVLEVARIIVLNGGDPKLKDVTGKSPLEYAEDKMLLELIEIYRGN